MTTPLRSKIPDPSHHQTTMLKDGNWPEAKHRFTQESLWALDMAILTNRPLLIRGEPGIGKSQIARAAAAELGVPFLSHVIDERSDRDDLLYHYDAVSRLAQAQISSVLVQQAAGKNDLSAEKLLKENLAEDNFFRPGVLWWALDWSSAAVQATKFSQYCRTCTPPAQAIAAEIQVPCGPVVLIDEIDKADPSLPNGLLECLGTDGFRSAHLDRYVSVPAGGKKPLIVFTTNEERELPAAFLRRCLVLSVPFPEGENAREFLIRERARVWYDAEQISDEVCLEVAGIVLKERAKTPDRNVTGAAKPGAAEFLDLVHALVQFADTDKVKGEQRKAVQREVLEEIKDFALLKSARD